MWKQEDECCRKYDSLSQWFDCNANQGACLTKRSLRIKLVLTELEDY
jgi:hypothetical protein